MEEYLADQLPAKALADLLSSQPHVRAPRRGHARDARAADVGKVWELAQPTRRTPGAEPYDLVVVDAPATGHGVAVLERAAHVRARPHGRARSRGRARTIDAMLADPQRTGVVAVARGEELPVNETLSLRDALRERMGLDAERSPSSTRAARPLQRRGRATLLAAPAGPPVRAALSEHARARAQRAQLAPPAPRHGRRCARRVAAVRLRPELGADALGRLARRAGARAVTHRRAPRGQAGRHLRGLGRRRQDDDLRRARDGPGRRAAPRVAVVTIDPAKRLANSLGLEELGNEPRLVDPSRFAGHGLEMRGELWAMMLDAKRTFDELIERLSPDERDARRGAVATGSTRSCRARSPARRSSRRSPSSTSSTARAASTCSCSTRRPRATRWTSSTRPTGSPGSSRAARCASSSRRPALPRASWAAGRASCSRVLKRVTGVDLLQDLCVFFRALGGLIDGFKERAAGVKASCSRPGDDVPHRHLARARAGRGGDLLPRQAARGGDAVRRPRRQPRARRAARGRPTSCPTTSRSSSARSSRARCADTLDDFRVLAHRDSASIDRLRRRGRRSRPDPRPPPRRRRARRRRARRDPPPPVRVGRGARAAAGRGRGLA